MKIYTRTGDAGDTGLLNSRVKKNNFRIEIIGQIDELMAFFAMLIEESKSTKVDVISELKNIYENIFVLQSYVADELDKYNFRIVEQEIKSLEDQIDEMTKELPVLKNFIYCTGHKCAVLSHQVRTKVRTIERLLVTLSENSTVDLVILKYINRLSDYLFTLARYINIKEGIEEEILKI